MPRGLAILAVVAAVAVLPSAAAVASGPTPRQERAEHALQRVKDLKQGIGVRTGRELTPALRDLALGREALDAAGRREADLLLARPTQGPQDPQNDGYSNSTTPVKVCGTHFCVHYVTTSADAPSLTDTSPANGVPDYVDETLRVFEQDVFPCENGSAALGCAQAAATGMGWPQPPSDLTETPDNGGDGRFDVYLLDLGTSVFGYAATDPQPAGESFYSYMVLDDDYAGFGYADPTEPLKVTAAHEYNHVLQYGIDPFEDGWMFESTATWAEEKVYPQINDYLGYLTSWVGATASPLTAFGAGGGTKIYGSAVWNHFIDGRHGRDTILDAWQAKNRPVANEGSFAPGSYDTAIAANGGAGFAEEFEDFSARVAEWRTPGAGFPDNDLYNDVPRAGTLTVGGAPATIQLDHTTFDFRNIAVPPSATTLTLKATLPAGLDGGIALVGRTGGSTTAGTVTSDIARTTGGGTLSVSLANANGFGRITAVLINADASQQGVVTQGQTTDWDFTRDNQNFTAVQVTAATTAVPATGTATDVGATGARLNGIVNPNGVASTAWFEYGRTTSYGSQTQHLSVGSGSTAVPQSAAITGLAPGTTYHFRMVAQSGTVTVRGADATFTTLAPPLVTTGSAEAVDTSGATLTGTVDPRGRHTTYVFEYGETTAYGNEVGGDAGAAGPVDVANGIGGLAPATTYHYRLVATNADGEAAGADRTLTTAAVPGPATTTTTGTTGSTGAPGAGSVPRALSLSLALTKGRLAAVLRRGLKARAGCGRPCALRLQLILPAKLAKQLRVKRTVATGKATLPGDGRVTVTLRFTKAARRALARVKKMSATVRLSATTTDGGRAALSRKVTLRR